MLKKVLLILAVLVAAFAVVVSMQPNTFTVTRSATMAAPAYAPFAQIYNLKNWEKWSPWAKMDPDAKTTYEAGQLISKGPVAKGKGDTMKWSGNNKVGTGSLTIVEKKSGEYIKMELTFVKPMPGTNDVEFTFKPEGKNTVVTWTMTGKMNFISKAMGLFMDCEKMVGENFEQGLAEIKKIVEVKLDTQEKPKAASKK